MANREQRSNREKKKPKKEKPKGAPVVSTFTTESGKGYSQEKVSSSSGLLPGGRPGAHMAKRG